MHVASVTQSEVRATVEVMIELVNELDSADFDARRTLGEAGFSRSANSSDASIRRLTSRLQGLEPLIVELPNLQEETAIAKINEELTELPISPSIASHDDVGPHIHWTPATATFDDQVISDILMALAQEVCDNGTIRFGICSAVDCDRRFYDGTRNRSKRFCSDPRCASRTHTADHRARQKEDGLASGRPSG